MEREAADSHAAGTAAAAAAAAVDPTAVAAMDCSNSSQEEQQQQQRGRKRPALMDTTNLVQTCPTRASAKRSATSSAATTIRRAAAVAAAARERVMARRKRGATSPSLSSGRRSGSASPSENHVQPARKSPQAQRRRQQRQPQQLAQPQPRRVLRSQQQQQQQQPQQQQQEQHQQEGEIEQHEECVAAPDAHSDGAAVRPSTPDTHRLNQRHLQHHRPAVALPLSAHAAAGASAHRGDERDTRVVSDSRVARLAADSVPAVCSARLSASTGAVDRSGDAAAPLAVSEQEGAAGCEADLAAAAATLGAPSGVSAGCAERSAASGSGEWRAARGPGTAARHASKEVEQEVHPRVTSDGAGPSGAAASSAAAAVATAAAAAAASRRAAVPAHAGARAVTPAAGRAAREEIERTASDPQFCGRYVSDIYGHLQVAELRSLPRPDYMECVQGDVTSSMRAILMDWLVEVAEEYKLVPDTLYLTCAYVDSFLSNHAVPRSHLQLLGITCMLIAAKFEEIYAPQVDEFCYITDNTYTRQEVLQMECRVLNHLSFDLSKPTAKTFLRRFIRVAQASLKDPSLKLEFLGNFFSELALTDYRCLRFRPSCLAAAAVFLAKLTLFPHMQTWTDALHACSGYSAADLLECVTVLHALHRSDDRAPPTAVHQKYCQAKFMGVASVAAPSSLPAHLFSVRTHAQE